MDYELALWNYGIALDVPQYAMEYAKHAAEFAVSCRSKSWSYKYISFTPTAGNFGIVTADGSGNLLSFTPHFDLWRLRLADIQQLKVVISM